MSWIFLLKRWLILLGFVIGFIVLISNSGLWEASFKFLLPGVSQVFHPRASLPVLVGEHIRLVVISSALTILIGMPLGIWVTRPGGRALLPIANDLTSLGQTFPPVAILALSVPILGFGLAPTVFALFLYGLMPVVRNTIAGLQSVSWHILDAAYGMGMTRAQALFRVEVPLAAPVILAGIRISVIINIGTAMVGAVIGAGGLGSPIIAGLVQNNLAFVLEGAVPAALLAVLTDQLMSNIEKGFTYVRTKS